MRITELLDYIMNDVPNEPSADTINMIIHEAESMPIKQLKKDIKGLSDELNQHVSNLNELYPDPQINASKIDVRIIRQHVIKWKELRAIGQFVCYRPWVLVSLIKKISFII